MMFNIVASGALMMGDFIMPTWSDLILFIGCGLFAELAQLAIFRYLSRKMATS
ncbi:hypothetical protein HC752_12680 [Vibrio sp. S9_S30]|uniref:hypothetical protein n=1 Tax=Vibrio sp. S9_S30 TaxID=2720226 RepID=UPI0016801A1C|nr:hypothetical protein [Vibrio sp. S9_S30]MBD1557789.1 hypothetical protein [Vibrio sp. S9_S30]